MFYVILLLVFHSGVHLASAQSGSYRAAVVEFSPENKGNSSTDIVVDNIGKYVNFIETAAKEDVQIIIFPENGLTGLNVNNFNDIRQISTLLPDPKDLIEPCLNGDQKYGIVLVYLSCAVKVHGIYTVVNLIEKGYDNETKEDTYYNTNVVFDRNGAVMASSRNYNINDQSPVRRDKIPHFKTDFGAKFGIMTPHDVIAFNHNTRGALSNESITNVVYPNTWYSTLPFYSAVSVVHGFATANEVNMLSASLHDPKNANGGSGVFLSDGSVEEVYQADEPGSKLIIKNVPLGNTSNKSKLCKNPQTQKTVGFDLVEKIPNLAKFKTNKQDLTQYSYRPLALKEGEHLETLCSNLNKTFCCTFNITLRLDKDFKPNYQYMLVIYDGIDSTLATAVHVRNCAIVACLTNEITSCGERDILPPVGVTLENINIKSTLETNNSYTQPSTLTFDLQTAANYTYCEQVVNETMKQFSIERHDDEPILTFGLFSKISDLGKSSSFKIALSSTLFLMVNLLILTF